jgi:hypothetical protein
VIDRVGRGHTPADRLFAYAMASARHERAKRFGWFLVAATIPALLFSTSTRTTLALIVVPLAIAPPSRRERVNAGTVAARRDRARPAVAQPR